LSIFKLGFVVIFRIADGDGRFLNGRLDRSKSICLPEMEAVGIRVVFPDCFAGNI